MEIDFHSHVAMVEKTHLSIYLYLLCIHNLNINVDISQVFILSFIFKFVFNKTTHARISKQQIRIRDLHGPGGPRAGPGYKK